MSAEIESEYQFKHWMKKISSRLPISYTRFLWFISAVITFTYILFCYILPSIQLGYRFYIANRFVIELVLLSLPILGAIVAASKHLVNLRPTVTIEEDVLWFGMGSSKIGISCLDISNAGSIVNDEIDGITKYDSSFLLALRSGLAANTNISFEAGTSSNGPYLRFFVSVLSNSKQSAKEILIREKMKLEAILLSAISNIEFQSLRDSHLMEAVGISNLDGYDISSGRGPADHLFVLKGTPKTNPSSTSSQIGNFLATAMKKGITAHITAVFSVGDGKSERRKMEHTWKKIQNREKNKEESLEDWTKKKKLIRRYQEVESKNGWFDCSTYVVITAEDKSIAEFHAESVSGMIQSIWGGDTSFSLDKGNITTRNEFRLLTRRHITKTRLHAKRLVAYVNTPVQSLPMLYNDAAPVFQIPSLKEISNELSLGGAIYQGNKVGGVGVSEDMLREHMAVLGATGTGKTTLVKKLMAEISTKTDVPWWIFDVKGSEYSDFRKIDGVMVIRAGLDPSFSIPLIDASHSSEDLQAQSTFSILRELIREESTSELSPAMEQLLFKAVNKLARNAQEKRGVQHLIQIIRDISEEGRTGMMTRDALLNRLEILYREPLGGILSGNDGSIDFMDLLKRRVVFDLRYVARIGGMDAARLLYNLVAKRIFESAMRRGISKGLNHVVVLEEASNLVPEIYGRSSAADVSTGESMVMLQRATGQAVIVVSTRPNISSNILANTATKVAFRLPYDSELGSRFLSIEKDQERYLKILRRGRALISLPGLQAFEMETRVFQWSDYREALDKESSKRVSLEADSPVGDTREIQTVSAQQVKKDCSLHFNRASEITSQLVAFMASKQYVIEKDIRKYITKLSPKLTIEEIDEMIHNLISLGTVTREAIPLVEGGFVFTLPGKGTEAVSRVILNYLNEKLNLEDNSKQLDDFQIVMDGIAIIIIGENIRSSSLSQIESQIRVRMEKLGNSVQTLYTIVRGSIPAEKLRERLSKREEFDSVAIVSAFPSSLDTMISEISGNSYSSTGHTECGSTSTVQQKVKAIEAVHKGNSMATRAIQIRIWIGLIQEFIEVSKGMTSWKTVLEFIETTVLQSKRARTVPLNTNDGKRAVTELLADEVLSAIRIGEDVSFLSIDPGLWIVNAEVLMRLKRKLLDYLIDGLSDRYSEIFRNHEIYDLCVDDVSYVIFPNQQQLSTLMHLHSDVFCRKCNTGKVLCILSAAEYFDEREKVPENIVFRFLDKQPLYTVS